MTSPISSDSLPRSALPPPRRRPVNLRSVSLGLFAVLLVACFTAYNDYVVNNTSVVGSQMPLVVVGFFVAFVVAINAPLRRFAPRHAFGSHELAVSLGMMLVGCTLPSIGLFRYLPGHLTGFYEAAAQHGFFADVMRQLDLPEWMFPAMAADDPMARGNDPVVTGFVGRVPMVEPTFTARLRAVPWSAWITPALTWAALLACLYGAILCMAVIFRRQWVENERLPFPLASIYLSLIEEPAPGKALGPLFRARGFWIGAAAVFCAHSLNALHEYAPTLWPAFPLHYDLTGLFASPPWSSTEPNFQTARIYFILIGIMFFVQTKIVFSLWFLFLVLQLVRMIYGTYRMEISLGMQQDQLFGAILVFAGMILWIARRHLAMIARQMVGRARPNEATGRYLPYPLAAWGLVACIAGMTAWLTLAGMTVIGAVVLSLMLLMILMVLARVVAEIGLPFVLLQMPLNRPWLYMLADVPASMAFRTTLRNYFFNQWFFGMFLHDTRESLAVYATHAHRVADEAAYPNERDWRRAIPFTFALILALLVSYVAAGASMLYVEYAHDTTLDQQQLNPINNWGAHGMPAWGVLDPTRAYVEPGIGPREPHSRLGHFTFGAIATGFLAIMRLSFAWWPLHPVGLLLVHTWGVRLGWFSIMIGWILKTGILRLGGAKLFRQARPFFIGLIIGEAGAAAFWLLIALTRLAMGLEYHAIRVLPR